MDFRGTSLPIFQTTCSHCPGRIFTPQELAKHQKERHEARLRCTHCDFHCDNNLYNWMERHYQHAHNIRKGAQNLFDKHQVPASVFNV